MLPFAHNMRLFGAESEPYSQVSSFKSEEYPSGILVQGDWDRIQQIALAIYRGKSNGTIDLVTGKYTRPSEEILSSAPAEDELEKLANLQEFDEDGYSRDTKNPRGYSLFQLQRLDPNKYWLGGVRTQVSSVDHPYVAEQRAAVFYQSLAAAHDLSYGIKRQEVEIAWDLATDEMYRLSRTKLVDAIQSSTGVEFDRKSLREFPDRPIFGESSVSKLDLELASNWTKRGASLELGKLIDKYTGEDLYPKMRLVIHPSEQVADIVYVTPYSRIVTLTFNRDIIESMRSSVQALSEVFKIGSIL